jgi:AraC-like DNA-binding protein
VLQRIMRFRTLYNLLQGRKGAWASAAVQAGYYDQPHANRDFRQFAGSNPSKHFARTPEIAQAFLSHSS